ncbi:hypothetical protein [Propylenella binzhouense]|uniref:Uncharacterized protein n=1 Tax=Propylenella binzhouense TaxID=2555902 RepID=A0A964T3L4_9HYPH|nr:hypothetical protein [Propylenella binzhouense]MYZ47312.1 hypothetical protein [Propylenella binzhouense]
MRLKGCFVILLTTLYFVASPALSQSDFLFQMPETNGDGTGRFSTQNRPTVTETLGFLGRKLRGAESRILNYTYNDCIFLRSFESAYVKDGHQLGDIIDVSILEGPAFGIFLDFRGDNYCDGRRNPREISWRIIIEYEKLQHVRGGRISGIQSFRLICHNDYRCIHMKFSESQSALPWWKSYKSFIWIPFTDDEDRIFSAFVNITKYNSFPDDPF